MGRFQFVFFVKFINAQLHQIAREIVQLLVNNVYEKRNTESQTDEILAVRALFVI